MRRALCDCYLFFFLMITSENHTALKIMTKTSTVMNFNNHIFSPLDGKTPMSELAGSTWIKMVRIGRLCQ